MNFIKILIRKILKICKIEDPFPQKTAKIFFVFLLTNIISGASVAHANWSMNVGYRNPVNSTAGLNFLYMWPNIGFEIGVGWIEAGDRTSSNSSSSATTTTTTKNDNTVIAGDMDLKWFLGGGLLRPLLQGGLTYSVEIGSTSSAGTGQGFLGAGVFLFGNPFHLYGIVNFFSRNVNQWQAGLGFNF